MMSGFGHDDVVWRRFAELAAGVLCVRGVDTSSASAGPSAEDAIARWTATAQARLAGGPESGFASIQAWRRAFSTMGLKPTQYRCAAEALLRRLRTNGDLPRLHPVVDLCNAASVAHAIPVAALDVAQIDGDLRVRPASGDEDYLTFGGEHEHPEPGEIVFADTANHAHARRWTNRQSGRSAVQARTSDVLIVAEGLHPDAAADVAALLDDLAGVLGNEYDLPAGPVLLNADRPDVSWPDRGKTWR